MNAGNRVLMALLCAVCAHALPANATLISAGSPVTFNLDFTAAGAYTGVSATLSGTGLDSGEEVSLFFFSDLNAPPGTDVGGFGRLGPGAVPNGAFAFEPFLAFAPGLLDGQFSVQLSVNAGSVDVTSLTVFATNSTEFPLVPIASQTLISSAVPEPATLVLIGLGLSGLALTRRRKTH